jgi:hypothetical protein
MRVLAVFPVFAVLFFAGSGREEGPSERDMRLAFEGALALQVRNAIEFVAETGGPDAVMAIREKGNDRFSIDAFQKLKCAREEARESYICEFSVDIGLNNGPLRKTLTGRFTPGTHGLVFLHDV